MTTTKLTTPGREIGSSRSFTVDLRCAVDRRLAQRYAMKFLFLLLVVLSLAACQSNDKLGQTEPRTGVALRVVTRPIQAYPLVIYKGTRAFTDLALIVDGKTVDIDITTDSNAMARKLFSALRWEILEPNTDKGDVRLFVVGQLFDGVSRSRDNPHGNPAQDYQEFRMERWYLVSPFKAVIETDSPDLEEKFKIVTRTRLEKSDFRRDMDGLDPVINGLHRSGI